MWQVTQESNTGLTGGQSIIQEHPSFLLHLQAETMGLHHAAGTHADSSAQPTGLADTYTLRLAAIFVILVAGLIGVMPPLIGSWMTGSPNGVTARLIRGCSGGIILSLALVSMWLLEGLIKIYVSAQ